MQKKAFSDLVNELNFSRAHKIIFSKCHNKSQAWQKIRIEALPPHWQVSKFTRTQVFHENVDAFDKLPLNEYATAFKQISVEFNDGGTAQLLCNKKGTFHISLKYGKATDSNAKDSTVARQKKQAGSPHNRVKNYLLQEGSIIPPLIDMGVMDEAGRVFPSKYDKFKQINRFLELIDDSFKNKEIGVDKPLHIIDFGCGKAYLTFVVYYYFQYIRQIPVHITGLDLKQKVIHDCNLAAQKYGYDKLKFEIGDINGFKPSTPVDMVITLHACDTATDFALYNAISWEANYIFSVPCCQHELNQQIQSQDLGIFTRYGIIKERTAALLTDAIRANLLSAYGYQTQVVEFIDLEHTPKNIMIRASKQNLTAPIAAKRRKLYLEEVQACLNCFNLKPCLYRLLEGQNEV